MVMATWGGLFWATPLSERRATTTPPAASDFVKSLRFIRTMGSAGNRAIHFCLLAPLVADTELALSRARMSC